jgi:hypothetical protein
LSSNLTGTTSVLLESTNASRTSDHVSLASSDADMPPRPSSFIGSPVEMFPDANGLSFSSGVIAGGATSPSGSHTSALPYLAMQTLVSGLQDMFHRQAVATQEDHQDRRRFEAEMKTLLESTPIIAALPSPEQHSNSPQIGQYYSAHYQPSVPHSDPQ